MIAWPCLSWSSTFQDALGRKVTLASAPRRIIPLAPNITEILYYLGLGDKVIGVTEYSNYPPDAALKPSVGSYVNPNIEKIISLSPDLVIGTKDGNLPASVSLLEEAKIPVYVINPRNVRDVITTITEIGNLCGVSEKAAQLAGALQRRLELIETLVSKREKPKVFLQINVSPIMTVNSTTFQNDLIRLAGGINISAGEPITYPRISIEEVIRKKPDIIIITSMGIEGEFEKAKEDWMKWPSIPAVKDNRVYLTNPDLIDRPSQRIIDGLETMARLIHPEVDWKKLNIPTQVGK